MHLFFFLCLFISIETSAQGPSPHACLKSSEVNWRAGPGYEHPVRWTFSKGTGWPVVLRKKCWHWYYVEDAQGCTGWVHAHLLSFKRTLLITKDRTPLRSGPNNTARVVAYLKKGVVGRCHRQKKGWYRFSVTPYKGWVASDSCWDPH